MLKLNKDKTISVANLLPHQDVSSIDKYEAIIQSDGTILIRFYDSSGLMAEPQKKPIKCTKNLIEAVRLASNNCYSTAVSDMCILHNKDRNTVKRLFKEDVDEHYRKLLCKLDSGMLDAIIILHQKKHITRAKITLAAITDELTRRALLGDSSRNPI